MRNPQRLLAGLETFENLDRRRRDLQLLGEESDQGFVGLSLHRGRSHPYFNPVSIGTHNLIPGGFGLEIHFQENLVHLPSTLDRKE
jgi:hypothetical protein